MSLVGKFGDGKSNFLYSHSKENLTTVIYHSPNIVIFPLILMTSTIPGKYLSEIYHAALLSSKAKMKLWQKENIFFSSAFLDILNMCLRLIVYIEIICNTCFIPYL